MQHTVAFVNPSGLFVDQIKKIESGLQTELLSDGLLADGKVRGGTCGVDESEFVGDLHLRGHGRDAQRDANLQRNLRVHLDDVAPGSKAFGAEVKAIDAKGQIVQHVVAIIGNLKA